MNPDSKSHLVEYFNSKNNQWIKGFGNITGVGKPSKQTISGVTFRCINGSPKDRPISLDSVDNNLYVGLQRDKTFKNFVTHGPLSGWSQLPKMATPFTGCTVAYLNRYLYTVGGYATAAREKEFVYGCQARRFNIDTKIWEDLPPIPSSPETTSIPPVVTPFMGKLFVYAAGKGGDERCLFVFDPVHKTWKYHSKLNVSWVLYDDPRFVIEDSKLFRVLFEKSIGVKPENHVPNIEEFVLNKSATSIKLSNQQDQSSRVYVDGHDTFVIGESLFVNLKGYMHKLQISKDQWNPYVIRQRICSLRARFKNKNTSIAPVFCKYTFDKVDLRMDLPSK